MEFAKLFETHDHDAGVDVFRIWNAESVIYVIVKFFNNGNFRVDCGGDG